ncbi:hypothetical protein RHOSPDRAFT_12418, partial [Rhodotorula sp. JG-1b]
PKKKKAGRACAACQKAHLTCDDARPCARCVKKGCPEECVDGARKKAKYLQEIPDEREQDFPFDSRPAGRSFPPRRHAIPAATAITTFGSEAAGFEYAILNAMLNGNGSLFGPPPTDSNDPAAADSSSSKRPGGSGALTAEEVYRNVTKPYPYAQSYHYLVKHLKERFDKNDILRIIRALATFRPSLIALQMPLTEEDETFVERTFQRTLVELNKLISFSGTPTVVWRRTGEICLVGTEFCLLTGWKREELVGKKYIFELFDTSSVVEYYESFAKHAFESTATSITMQCVVLAPDGRPVPCAFCFSVRRDLFSCPFLVIGSFLPIL